MNTAVSVPNNTMPAPITAFDIMMNPEMMSRFEKLAETMASSKFSVPKHLQNNPSDCLAVIMQSVQWQMDPFAVAQKTHQINGTLGYEAQLVNAVIINRAPVTGRLQFEWYGDWAKINGKEDKSWDKGVKVWATLKGETTPREITLSMGQVGPVRNSPLWLADPRQQLAYLAIKRWSRLYTPDVILGVYTPDEIVEREEVDVTPAQSQVKKHQGAGGLKAQMAEREQQQEATVIDMESQAHDSAPYDVDGAIDHIKKLNTIAELKEFSKAIPSDIAEDQQAKIKETYSTQYRFVQVLDGIEAAKSLEALDGVMAKSFEPHSANFNDPQTNAINLSYEQKQAALTA
ncbi:hypothetical protein GCM10023206_07450 [Acinetobacter puyangensis]|uniref:RecT family protein n=1 Tax=Acinetobacter puyangensis TaxID=1096779 RepID=A0A240E8E0_9GAMM|nr:RecT family recombinase [Acinetobacter puyangensis]SNX44175.1 RecT family protein [Acinetobacter puyangensis]